MEKCISEAIAEALEADLASGRWKPGERLPPVDELRARFGAGEYAVRHTQRLHARFPKRARRHTRGLARMLLPADRGSEDALRQ